MKESSGDIILFSATFKLKTGACSDSATVAGSAIADAEGSLVGQSETLVRANASKDNVNSFKDSEPESRLPVTILFLPPYEVTVDVNKWLTKLPAVLKSITGRNIRLIKSDPPYAGDSAGGHCFLYEAPPQQCGRA